MNQAEITPLLRKETDRLYTLPLASSVLTYIVMTVSVYTMNEINAEAFGQWIRSLREGRGESLRVTGAAVGMDPSILSRIEHGGRLPTPKQALSLAGHLGVSGRDIMSRRIAAEFLMKYGNDECAHRAVGIVKEALDRYGSNTGN